MDNQKLSRKQVRELLDTVPASVVLGKEAVRELTPNQRRFALEVAKGAKGADAYRKAYKTTTKRAKTVGNAASELKRHPGVAREIEAYQVALRASEYRTPAALRALVVQTLTQTIIDDDTPPSVKVQAARVLGTVTEVAAFTQRTEVTRVDGSAAAKEKLLDELRSLMARTIDVDARDVDADSLLRELAGPDPHPEATPPDASATHHGDGHSNPPIQSENIAESPPPPSDSDTPGCMEPSEEDLGNVSKPNA